MKRVSGPTWSEPIMGARYRFRASNGQSLPLQQPLAAGGAAAGLPSLRSIGGCGPPVDDAAPRAWTMALMTRWICWRQSEGGGDW